MEKYVNEKTLIKDDVFKSLPEDLIICPICTLLMIEPVMCLNCLNNFCKNCQTNGKKRIIHVQMDVKMLPLKLK